MAGDWIKMRSNLKDDPRVIAMAEELEIAELHIVGCLFSLWSWADQHTETGNALSVTDSFVDRNAGVTGFAQALRNVGWLDGKNGSLTLPNFAEHNGKPAKTRAQTKKRVEEYRNANVTHEPLPEKRREEKSNITHTPPAHGEAPISVQQAKDYAPTAGVTPEVAEAWWYACDANEWLTKTDPPRPLKNWQSSLKKFSLSHAEIQAGKPQKTLPSSKQSYRQGKPDRF